ncbi:uncharacterized protein LOC141854433 [Brevipalpus obovatus]|uniref:uncharacterized protein LOC141854433 n=1 Tax=Brevipalpus obovatus TaxID=246614 RepID=UPI003D9DC422
MNLLHFIMSQLNCDDKPDNLFRPWLDGSTASANDRRSIIESISETFNPYFAFRNHIPTPITTPSSLIRSSSSSPHPPSHPSHPPPPPPPLPPISIVPPNGTSLMDVACPPATTLDSSSCLPISSPPSLLSSMSTGVASPSPLLAHHPHHHPIPSHSIPHPIPHFFHYQMPNLHSDFNDLLRVHSINSTPKSMSPTSSMTNSTTNVAPSKPKHQRPKRFRCEHCGIAFSNNGQLKGHVRTHTGERPYACDHPNCGKTFSRNEELTRHKRIHTGHRPYKCEACQKKFGRKDHLKKHIKTHQRTPTTMMPGGWIAPGQVPYSLLVDYGAGLSFFS